MTTERCVALALLTKGAKPTKEEMARYAEALGVTKRSVYRYLDKIERAKFLIKEITKC